MKYEGPGSPNQQPNTSGTLRGNRNVVSEMDVRLAMGFRNAVAEEIRKNASKVAPNAPHKAHAHLDGDSSVNIVVPNHPGKHRPLIIAVTLPPDPFQQFVYGSKKVEIAEVKSGVTLQILSWEGKNTAREVARVFVEAMRKWIDSGEIPNELSGSATPGVPKDASVITKVARIWLRNDPEAH